MSRPRHEVELDQLEGRNVVFEAFSRGRRKVRRLWLDARAKPEDKVSAIQEMAAKQGLSIKAVAREELDRVSLTGVHNGIIAWAEPLPELTVNGLLDQLFAQGKDPFLVLIDEVQYEQNLGAILRSALGAQVDGVIIPTQRGKGLTPVVQRVAMGAAEVVPVVREGILSALATLRRAGIPVVGADMDGKAYWNVPMAGSCALVLGGEDKGLTPTVRSRCDHIASIPLDGRIQSLNVSVTAGVLFFERVRQQALAAAPAP